MCHKAIYLRWLKRGTQRDLVPELITQWQEQQDMRSCGKPLSPTPGRRDREECC